MIQNILGKIRGLFLQKDSLIICILTGILLLIIGWPIEKNEKKEEAEGVLWDTKQDMIDYEDSLQMEETENEYILKPGESTLQEEKLVSLEQRLEELLGLIDGVGMVKVMITLDSLGQKVLEKDNPVERNIVTETDSQGGSRSTNNVNNRETTVYVTDSQGNKIPFVVTETLPSVGGVTVVCTGGDNDLIEKDITEVIQALFGIEVHKIKIVKMKQME